MGFSCLEQCELAANIATLGLVFRHKDALGHEVVGSGAERRAVCKLFYAIEAVGWHLVGGDEHGLRLPLTPLIESFVVETSFVFFYISACAFVWNIAIYHAVFGYRDFFVVKHRGCDR